ncbi:MAG: penicillin-binding protein 2 [Bryobacteraceae bacterium]|nr:penicillin-binding protein 2 [Bryobacteraceae bacterium]
MLPVEREREDLNLKPRPPQDDPRFAAGRIAFFQYITVAAFVFLLSGFWELQIGNPEFYSERAERNRIKALPILAPRGKIVDRDGRIVVDNHSSYSLILSRENLKPEHLKTIADGLNLDYDELVNRIRRFERTRPKYEPVIIKEELTPGELAFVDAYRSVDGFPELELIHAQKRQYPTSGLAAHVIGYVGEVSEAELNTLEFARYRPGDVIGKSGIERYYNNRLMGVDGQRRVLVDNLGRERQVMGMEDATPGQDLHLTLDLDLQAVAELAMEGRQGAVVALDPRNGEVLAMVSRPSYNPNKFAGRIRSRDWKELTDDPQRPLLNRAIQAQLAPGSTFKPIVALAGLETGEIDSDFSVYCNGGATFYGRFFKCHARGGHGRVDLYRGLVQSCDVYFYNAGNRLGIDKIAEYAEMAGFGKPTGIDLPHEASGLVPSTRWKLRTYRDKWYAGETISVSIGQGALTVTPLQLAAAIGGLALGGVWHTPHMVKNPDSLPPPRTAHIDLSHAIQIVNALYGVVNDGGTGIRAWLPGIEVCGKTGTAQLASNEAIRSGKVPDTLKDNAWFFGFAPRQDPELIVVALFEHAEHGPNAAPIVRDVIKAYFDKKARQSAPPVLLSSSGAPASGAAYARRGE